RQTFHRDVVIDLFCYRRHGHNEGDEPSFTQPIMYSKIQERPTLSEIYTEQLILTGVLTVEEQQQLTQKFQARLQQAKVEVKTTPARFAGVNGFSGAWQGLTGHYSHDPVQTGVSRQSLDAVAEALTRVPEHFTVHPKIARMLEQRREEIAHSHPIDWPLAE